MVSVKMLKPYYIKTDARDVRVVLAYQYFSILINEQVYHFIPIEAKEIQINRQTKRIVNIEAKFAFQKGKDIVRISMTDLISLPDFLIQLYFIVETHYAQVRIEGTDDSDKVIQDTIEELEWLNIKRLIDKALDEKDRKTFDELSKLIKT